MRYFEDFQTGQVFEYGAYRVTRDEVIAFANEFDPQPQHRDEESAAKTMLGKLCASGWHTTAMTMRMHCDGFLADTSGLGAPGIEECRWVKPVLPGDVLRVRATIGKTRASMSRPEMGLVEVTFEVMNDRGELVMSQRCFNLFGRRGFEAAPQPDAKPPAAPPAESSPMGERDVAAPVLGYLEDIVLGQTLELGAYEFTRENVTTFARAYDPQPFHLDDQAAQRSHFGRLAASGWHTAAAYMKCMIATRDGLMNAALARGETLAPRGPSPGFTNLRWLRPVYPGDVIRYSSTPVDKRPTSKPGWGLVFTLGAGVNQDGARVYEYRGSSFRPLRG